MLTKEKKDAYARILKQELQAALGCTEPIAIAYGVAYAVKLLGKRPEKYIIECSGNIIKNVKAVTVPQTGGQKGIETAALSGGIGGDPQLGLEVLTKMTPQQREEIAKASDKGLVSVKLLDTPHTLHIIATVLAGDDKVSVEIIDTHTGIGNVIKNGEYLHRRADSDVSEDTDEYKLLNVKDILAYAEETDLSDIKSTLEQQINYNTAIAAEGLANPWGACVGKTILSAFESDKRMRIVASAAAGSDARMNGCTLPVVINSGSGNQGLTVSMPVIEYAKMINAPHDKLLRALCVSNLTAIHQKTSIGRLSAFCGAVSAATGAVIGIAYLDGASYEVIAKTITNSLGNIGGMVCDGAKSSCAAKISSALFSALLGYRLAKNDLGFKPGEGIVKNGVEETIASVGRMASKGMKSTDKEILEIMIEA